MADTAPRDILDVEKKNMLSWDLKVAMGGAPLCLIDNELLAEKGTTDVDGKKIFFTRDSLMQGKFHVEVDGHVLATAHKPEVLSRTLEFTYDLKTYKLECDGKLTNNSTLYNNMDQPVGHVTKLHALGYDSKVELPSTFPRAVQLFIVWLVFGYWQRQASSHHH
eukprot:TRINITY_DN9228_c0_g1_i1.p2 TRINITY_DN9228_c0_g1~~TRINITY_DN9228_c0_g1_i1.p2  ORF type:complete len:164 (-),score=47.12 TRINITY_DN9228_c0_g1_i1:33-524(-)